MASFPGTEPADLPARKLTEAEVDDVMWFCVSCCGVSTWAQFAQLIMHCERNPYSMNTIKSWRECQTGKQRDYAIVRVVQAEILPLIEEYKYAKRV